MCVSCVLQVPECQMVDDDAWVRYRAMGYVHSNAYHVNHKKAVVAPPTYAAAGAKSYGVRSAPELSLLMWVMLLGQFS